MEKRLKFDRQLSLEEMSLRKGTVQLWRDSDILAAISKFRYNMFSRGESEAEWRETIENKVKGKMLELALPQLFTRQMIEMIRPIGLEIRKWLIKHEDYFLDSNGESIPFDVSKLCWTSAGAVDNRKTAEKLVRCDVLDIDRRYRLACLYCLEDDIPLLWEELPEGTKIYYLNHKDSVPLLPYCWPYIFKGELSELDSLLSTSGRDPFSFYQYVFEYSALSGKRTAAEYFFRKLSHEERVDSLSRIVPKAVAAIKNFNIFDGPELFPEEKFSRLLFLLSLMTPEYQKAIFLALPVDVLFTFLDWPWQDLFLENADFFWTVLTPDSYGDLLSMMCDRYTISDVYVPMLFRELFALSPLGFKKCFVDPESEFYSNQASNFLALLFDSEDSETIGVIFRNLDAADRIKLFFHDGVLKKFYEHVMAGKWHVVNVCLREATLSKEDRERLKGMFIGFLETGGNEERNLVNQNSKRFFELLDEFDASADKKN